jgi:hypothetical protein
VPGPWISITGASPNFREKVADLLGKTDVSLLKIKDSVLQDSITAAYADIVTRLAGRQYTKAQIDLWDRRVEFNTDIALFWAFTKGGIPNSFSDVFIKALDRRSEMEKDSFRLLIADAVVEPGGDDGAGISGEIGYGRIATDYCPPRWDGHRTDRGYGW